MYYEYHFPPVKTRPFMGSEKELQSFLQKNPNLKVVKGGPGCYKVAEYTTGEIYEYPDEYSVHPIRTIIPTRNYINKLSKKIKGKKEREEGVFQHLIDDLNSGYLSIDSVEEVMT